MSVALACGCPSKGGIVSERQAAAGSTADLSTGLRLPGTGWRVTSEKPESSPKIAASAGSHD